MGTLSPLPWSGTELVNSRTGLLPEGGGRKRRNTNERVHQTQTRAFWMVHLGFSACFPRSSALSWTCLCGNRASAKILLFKIFRQIWQTSNNKTSCVRNQMSWTILIVFSKITGSTKATLQWNCVSHAPINPGRRSRAGIKGTSKTEDSRVLMP